jgi:hypothetical protein
MARGADRPARNGGAPARARLVALALGCLALLADGGSALAPRPAPPSLAAPDAATVGTAIEPIRVRNAPAQDGLPLVKAPTGARLRITGKPRDGYYPVAWGRIRGWAPTGSLETPDRALAPGRGDLRDLARGQRAVAAANLNVRQQPDPAAPVVAGLRRRDPADLTGEERDGYLQVRVDGGVGWVLGRYLEVPPPDAAAGEDLKRADIVAIIHEAADRYGQDREDMLRVARCESDLVPTAVNSVGGSYGLFQFKPFTWDSTPYAEYDIFDPRANAYAAAWMWSVGRRNEWVCQ